jgi:DNA-binding transcriptional ArsR family regulator
MEMNLKPEEFESLAERFKILGEPTRLRILSAICGSERNVQDICDRTGLQQANVSKHLRLLKNAKIVACRRVGVCRYYRVIDPDLLHLCVHTRKLMQQQETMVQSTV